MGRSLDIALGGGWHISLFTVGLFVAVIVALGIAAKVMISTR